jgi:hypothetical protein
MSASGPGADCSGTEDAVGEDESREVVFGGHPHFRELSSLFNSFLRSELSRRYYLARMAPLKNWDTFFSVVVSVTTAAGFVVLTIPQYMRATLVGAILAGVGFVASIVVPVFKYQEKLDSAYTRVNAFNYAARQLHNTLKFVRDSPPGEKAVIKIWIDFAEKAYEEAKALPPDKDEQNNKLVMKIQEEINAAYPSDYVWFGF